jgi:poly(3-hydroxybutyrate) depolymerase
VASAFSVMKHGPAAAPPWPSAGTTSWPTPAQDTAADARAPAPVIVFHGDADPTVAAVNGDAVIAGALRGVDAVAEKIAAVDATGKRRARRTVWRATGASADAPTLAEQWLVEGTAHAWSGGAPVGSYTDPDGPDASREMLRFFLAHPRRRD